MKSKELNNRNKKIISDAFDQIMDEYAANNKIIFQSEAERAKHHFGLISKRLKDWKKSKQCMVPGCTERSINRSHAISKGISLSSICESGHLVTPEFDHQIGAMALKLVGTSQASTFPGFCSEHERLFEEFEKKKKLDTETHVYLQTYRAACRELFRSKFLIEQNEWLISSYCRLRDERLLELVKQRAINSGFPVNTVFSSLSYSGDPIVNLAADQILRVRQLFSHLEYRILPALQKVIFSGCEDDVFIKAVSIDLLIPVALSGCAVFFVSDHDIQKQVYLIMNILPCADHTLLIFSGDIHDKDYIQLYYSKWMTDALSMVSMIESWMVNGTDQWYLKPSIWNALPDDRRKSILKAILKCEQNIGEEYELSIFDDIRMALLEMLRKKEPTQDSTYWCFVESQKAKMI